MLQKIYAVKDTKAEYFMRPFYCFSEEEATRLIRSAVLDSTHPFSKNSVDFDLYYVGEFDDVTGIFQVEEKRKHITNLDVYKTNDKD